MIKKCRKSFIAVLLCLVMIVTQALPGIGGTAVVNAEEEENGIIAQAEGETEFKGASGVSGDLEWNITTDGKLTIEGKGNYKTKTIYICYPPDEYGGSLEEGFQGPEWLEYYQYIKTAKIDIKNITSTESMFRGCINLTNLDLNNFDTSNVKNMEFMFWGCNSMKNFNLSNMDTSNVIYMYGMFAYCPSLTSLDLSNFNTSNVIDMYDMFTDCTSLTSLDLSNFDTNNLKYTNEVIDDMHYVAGSFSLSGLESLEKLYFPANSPKRYELPSFKDYHWEDENGIHRAKTVKKLPAKMTYTKVDGSYVPSPDDEDDDDEDINTGIYADSSCTSLAAISTRTLFVNGGNVKQSDNTKINYKTKTYYTQLQASNIVTVNSKGKVKTKKGRLVAGITSTDDKPALINGKIAKDASASKIAKVSTSKGKVKVTAQKQPGVVYLWIMDTGDDKASVCAKIDIKAAPSKIQVFAKSSSDESFSSDKKNVYKKDFIDIGNSVKLYVYPSYKQNGQLQETKDASYSASVNEKSASYFTVEQDKNNPYCFIVTAKL